MAFQCSAHFFPIRFVRGDIYPLYVTATTDDGQVIDITGSTVTMTAKATNLVSNAAAIFTISTGTGDVVLTQPTLGQFCVTIPSSATLNVPETSFPCVYDVTIEIGPPYTSSLGFSGFSGLSGNGLYRNTIVYGSITLIPNVSDT